MQTNRHATDNDGTITFAMAEVKIKHEIKGNVAEMDWNISLMMR